MAGIIEADMTSLVKGHRIKASEPEKGYAGKRHYRIDFELVMIVNGRNLRCTYRGSPFFLIREYLKRSSS